MVNCERRAMYMLVGNTINLSSAYADSIFLELTYVFTAAHRPILKLDLQRTIEMVLLYQLHL